MRLLRFGPKGPRNRDCWMPPVGSAICPATSGTSRRTSSRPTASSGWPASTRRACRRWRQSAPRSAGRGRAELHLHRPELRRPRRRIGPADPLRADRVRQVGQRDQRPERSGQDPARLEEDRLGGRARRGDQPARPYVPANSALDYVAGYCVANDVSEREFQLERGGTWYKGKSSRPSPRSARGW